jgi:hypothetical protein
LRVRVQGLHQMTVVQTRQAVTMAMPVRQRMQSTVQRAPRQILGMV